MNQISSSDKHGLKTANGLIIAPDLLPYNGNNLLQKIYLE